MPLPGSIGGRGRVGGERLALERGPECAMSNLMDVSSNCRCLGGTAQQTGAPPVRFLSRRAPSPAEDQRLTRELASWSGAFEKPKEFLMTSAHWENAPVMLNATQDKNGKVDGFWGFNQNHRAWVPLKEVFPDTDVPAVQMALPTLEPTGPIELSRSLAPLRDRGTLIAGSGFTSHNLRWSNPAAREAHQRSEHRYIWHSARPTHRAESRLRQPSMVSGSGSRSARGS